MLCRLRHPERRSYNNSGVDVEPLRAKGGEAPAHFTNCRAAAVRYEEHERGEIDPFRVSDTAKERMQRRLRPEFNIERRSGQA